MTGQHRFIDQMGHDFGVGLAGEAAPLGGELLAQALEVLDNAVVHAHHTARPVGMGIIIIGSAMGRPARMPDRRHPAQRGGNEIGQRLHLARRP